MTEPKSHTPGPWKWRKGFLYGGEYNQIVCPTIYEDLHCDNPVDAYLIAAAPDLLVACEFAERYVSQTLIKTIVNSWDYEAKIHFRGCEALRLALVGAIKKAKGW